MPGVADALSVGSGVGGIIAGGLQIGMALHDEKKAKNELARLKTPFMKIQDEYLTNRNLAEINAGTGLPDATKAFMTKEAERGLGTGIRGILESGGSPNDIAKLFDVFDTSVSRVGVEDAERRVKNIGTFMDTQRELAEQKNIQFGVNELQPYQSALQNIQERRAAARQNLFGGITTALGAGSALGTSLSNAKMIDLTPKQTMYSTLFSPERTDAALPSASNPASRSLSNQTAAFHNTPLSDAMLAARLINPNRPI